jgi:hypothetical protein
MWGDVAPDTISFEQMSKWRAALEKKQCRGVAHETIRVWRTFWKIMLGMKTGHPRQIIETEELRRVHKLGMSPHCSSGSIPSWRTAGCLAGTSETTPQTQPGYRRRRSRSTLRRVRRDSRT